jgi:ATP-dependent Clp protease ATP-binding subunit ClpX
MEETEVDLKVPHDPISQLEAFEHYRKTGKREKRTINTKNILFIMTGAFNGLDEFIKQRVNKEGIGFGAEIRSKDERAEYLKQVKAEDLIAYGFESEFIGRLPVATVFEKLEVDDLYAILKNPNNPIILGKEKDFKSYGIDIRFEDEALYELAVKAYEEKTGARGLVSAVERVLIKFEKRLPSTDIPKFVVTREVVESPERELERLLQDPSNPEMQAKFEMLLSREKAVLKTSILSRKAEFKKRYGIIFRENRMIKQGYDVNTVFEEAVEIQRQVEKFEMNFKRRNGIHLQFNEEAIDRISEMILNEDGKAAAIFSRLSKNYEYGLELISDKTGQKEFIITRGAIDNPEGYLDRAIRGL